MTDAGNGRQGDEVDWAEIAERMLKGDELAALEITRLASRIVHGLRARDFDDEASDMIQSVVEKTLRALAGGSIRNTAALPGWMRTTARNLLADRIRIRQGHSERQTIHWTELPEGTLQSQPHPHLIAAVRQALRGLPEDMVKALDYIYCQGKTVEKTAELVEIPLGTFKSQLSNALNRLRTKLPHPDPEH